ncbi:hypothetical protein ANO11243_034630 [Dothideomycetidae sp. 11243]|nr:hypothetical protein ANO11243_034630 [fungal sp. No.11243]
MPGYITAIRAQNSSARIFISNNFKAGGTIGTHIATALSKTGRHTVTAISRKNSNNSFPSGILVARVDYEDESTLVDALKGQHFLVITMAPTAPRDTHSKLIQAAAKAGVPYVIPNWFAGDIDDVKFGQDTMLGSVAKSQRDEIEGLGMHWIAICCGFWYDYSLAGGANRFGFDFDKRSLIVYDDGNTEISTTTLSQVGVAVAKLLSLKEFPDDTDDKSLALSSFSNKALYVKSFVLSQNDMFESVKRVSGTTSADWMVTSEATKQRYEDGLAQVKHGDMVGFSKMLYARGFYPDRPSDLSSKAQNELLGLPAEDLDAATRSGIELVQILQHRTERMAA